MQLPELPELLELSCKLCMGEKEDGKERTMH